jgi:hypothetical protein
MVSWMNCRTNQTHEPHASPSTITTSRTQDGTRGDEAAIRKEILSLFAPPTDEDSESQRHRVVLVLEQGSVDTRRMRIRGSRGSRKELLGCKRKRNRERVCQGSMCGECRAF